MPLAAICMKRGAVSRGMPSTLLAVRGLKKHYEIRKGLLRRTGGYVKAVDGVDFDMFQGETFGLVGESGCGKTTVGRTLLRAHDPTDGDIWFHPGDEEPVNLAKLSEAEVRPLRRHMQMIFQDPYSSLSPRMTVRDLIAEPLRVSGVKLPGKIDDLVVELLEQVGLRPEFLNRYPHAFSGGQRQRIGIARALILRPQLIVADEAVSALDVSVQAQILELLIRLKREFGLSYLFISHDLSVVRYICERIGVMYVGRLIEVAPSRRLFAMPKHPYTAALLSSIPRLDPTRRRRREILGGDVPDPSSPPSGCHFHPRCKFAQDVCKEKVPDLRNIAGDQGLEHRVACHFAEELDLKVEA